MPKRASMTVVLCLLLAATCPAEKKRITLKSGRVFVGDVVEKTKEGIKVKSRFAVVFYPNKQIQSIEPVLDPKAEYARRLAKLDKKDANGYVKLGRWALGKKLYEQAAECFTAALKIRKDHETAPFLLRQAKAKLRAAGDKEPDDGDNGEDVRIPGRTPFSRKLLLKRDDIYRIRFEEIRPDDRVSIRMRNDVVEQFIRKMRASGGFQQKGSEARFRRDPPLRQALYIRERADRTDPLRDDVIVRTDPGFMREFRSFVWPAVAGSCGSINCHGAPEGQGKLKLLNLPGRSINVDYTNFLILDSFHKKGMFMIRRDQRQQSLLLHYSLPDTEAEYRHPKKKRPLFPSRRSSGYRRMLEWIEKLNGPRHPDYRIKYRPPNVMTRPSGLPGLPFRKPTTRPGKTKSVSPFS